MIFFKVDIGIGFLIANSRADLSIPESQQWVRKERREGTLYEFQSPDLVMWQAEYERLTKELGVMGFWKYSANLISAFIEGYADKLNVSPPYAEKVLGISRYYYGDRDGGFGAAFNIPANLVHVCSKYDLDIDLRHLTLDDVEYRNAYISKLTIVDAQAILPSDR